jgi:hypothetical protein
VNAHPISQERARRSPRRLRLATGVAGAVLISVVGGGGIAAALGEPGPESDVDVSVEIPEIEGPGTLALTVASDSTALAEDGSTSTERRFTGTLPTVTVTDTRSAEEIPEGAAWYVLGSISDFVGDAGQPAIPAVDSFGWVPSIVEGDPGSVAPGDAVEPGAGFVDQEVLASTWNSAETSPEGSWSADAALELVTPVTVAPGDYSATLTLSLFE